MASKRALEQAHYVDSMATTVSAEWVEAASGTGGSFKDDAKPRDEDEVSGMRRMSRREGVSTFMFS